MTPFDNWFIQNVNLIRAEIQNWFDEISFKNPVTEQFFLSELGRAKGKCGHANFLLTFFTTQTYLNFFLSM